MASRRLSLAFLGEVVVEGRIPRVCSPNEYQLFAKHMRLAFWSSPYISRPSRIALQVLGHVASAFPVHILGSLIPESHSRPLNDPTMSNTAKLLPETIVGGLKLSAPMCARLWPAYWNTRAFSSTVDSFDPGSSAC